MQTSPCHAPPSTPSSNREAARALILQTLTVRRVAGWCKISDSGVHQWLHRGSEDEPIPARVVPTIAKGAATEGIEFDLGVLWPAMAGIQASHFGSVRAREDIQ